MDQLTAKLDTLARDQEVSEGVGAGDRFLPPSRGTPPHYPSKDRPRPHALVRGPRARPRGCRPRPTRRRSRAGRGRRRAALAAFTAASGCLAVGRGLRRQPCSGRVEAQRHRHRSASRRPRAGRRPRARARAAAERERAPRRDAAGAASTWSGWLRRARGAPRCSPSWKRRGVRRRRTRGGAASAALRRNRRRRRAAAGRGRSAGGVAG